MKDKKEIIRRIKYLCKKQNLSQYELAKKSGLSVSSISNIFNRGTAPDIVNLQKIVYNGFGISMGEFFEEKDSPVKMDERAEKIYYQFLSLSKKNKNILERIIKVL